MKSRTLKYLTARALLAAPATPVRLAAQENRPKHRHYKLIDLGTFGGPASYDGPTGNGGPIMNRSGSFVGSSQTSIALSSDSNGFVCVNGPGVYHAFQWSDGVVNELPSLQSVDDCGNAMGINDSDEIAGQSEINRVNPLTGAKEIRAVRWEDGKVENLETFGGNDAGATRLDGMADRLEGKASEGKDDFEHAFEGLEKTVRSCCSNGQQGLLAPELQAFLALSRSINNNVTSSLHKEI